MKPITTLVEALHELAATGRLSEETTTKLTDIAAAERFRHPAADLERSDGPEHR